MRVIKDQDQIIDLFWKLYSFDQYFSIAEENTRGMGLGDSVQILYQYFLLPIWIAN